MAKNFEKQIAEIRGNFVVENIDTGFEPVNVDDIEGANSKICLLNFVLDQADEGNVEFYFNSKLKFDEDYLNSTYSLVYGFDLKSINKETLTVENGDYGLSLTHMLDNPKHYVIGIRNGDELIAFKLFNGFIVKYDICKHMADYTAKKASQKSERTKQSALKTVAECYGITIEEAEELLSRK